MAMITYYLNGNKYQMSCNIDINLVKKDFIKYFKDKAEEID